MRKTSMIVGSLFLLAVCTGCGKSDYAVTPENVALYAQGSSENSFFQLFDAAKDQAKVEEADGTTTYTLAELQCNLDPSFIFSLTFSSNYHSQYYDRC